MHLNTATVSAGMVRLALLVCASTCAYDVQAQTYPSRPLRLVVPFVAGGSTDVFARMVSKHLNEAWKQPVVIDNRAGAAGNIGTELVARATPDGYTLLMASPGFVINSNLHKHAGFDPLKDFAAVIFVSLTPLVVTVHPSVPAKALSELIDLARRQPGKLNFASAGSSTHLAAELLKSRAAVDLVHIPYKGTAPATADLIGGQVQLMLDNIQAVLPHIRAGRLRGLAVTSPSRAAQAPELPTVAESGYPGFQAASWFGLVAPAGTPQANLQQINREVNRMLARSEVRGRMAAIGAEPGGGNVQEFHRFIEQETNKWSKLISRIGLREQ
jgi:tripartite-type tricarboxylate transporter receptor subunit TctC